MTTIFIKDDLRASVEAATGGHVTVLYTAAGHPCYMNVIPKFNKQDIDAGLGTGVHEAFIVNGVEKSEIFIGQHLGIQKDGNLLSIPGVSPTASVNFDTFRGLAAANGPGWHMMTTAEMAAIALWSWKNGTMPRGNNDWGRDVGSPWETAARADGGAIGSATGNGKTYTGAGPASWRHNGQPSGIADLNGNLWEWNAGMRLQAGEIQIIQNNDAADNTKDQSATSSLWKAIDGSTGALVAPGSANAIKYATSGTTNYTLVRASGASLEGMTNPGTTPVGAAALSLAKSLGLYPVASTGLGGDGFWVDVTDERLPLAGGGYNVGALAGAFARALANPRSGVGNGVGARPAYVL